MQPKEAITNQIAVRSAEMSIAGMKLDEQVGPLSLEFGLLITKTKLENIRRKDIFKDILSKHKDEVVKASISRLKLETAKLTNKVMKALEDGLDSGNMTAVKLTLEILGIDNKNPQTASEGPLQIVMAGNFPIPDHADESDFKEDI